jgi:glycosyltransferase involved in cell wall biosynthesis
VARRIAKLVFVTQQVDPAHPALAATVPKVRALAARVEELVVLADEAVPEALPGNCRAYSFRAPRKSARGLRFETALARELRGLSAVVAHMCPIYAVLAAPLVRPLRIPLVLWFTHWRASRLLGLAERVSSAVATVDERSFPLASRKVRAIGHGIDLDEFPCVEPRPEGVLRVLALGRYSPAKGLETVLRALAQVDDARLVAHGPAMTEYERAHRGELLRLAAELGLVGRVHLEDAVPRSQVPELFATNDLLVNNMRAGAPDKVVYEAAASCLPVVASNPVFDSLLEPEWRFARGDPGKLAERLRAVAALPASERGAIGRRLHERVAAGHSVDSWAEGILSAAGLR